MKAIIALASAVLTLNSFSNTFEEAQALYTKRGEDFSNAKRAADIYQKLSHQAEQDFQKANLKTKQAQALYFYAGRLSSDKEKEIFHKQAFQVADEAIQALTGGDQFSDTPRNSAHKTELAQAHYFSAINMGRWAEARGVLASLGQWSNMKKHLEAVIKNDETVEDYGAHRTLGRAYMKLPFTHGGSNKKSEKYLRKAYDKTLNEDFETSANTTTTSYYLDILAARDKADTFCEVYDTFYSLHEASGEELKELNPRLVPETKLDLEKFESGKDYEEDIHDYAETNC